MKRIKWIDGLKGCASIGVFWHHFFLCFFPAAYFGAGAPPHLHNNWDYIIAESPLTFFIVGNFLVCMFCLLSGTILSLKVIKNSKREDVSKIIVTRYLKLALPLFIVCIIVYLIYQFNLFTNLNVAELSGSKWLNGLYSFTKEQVTFKDVLYESFCGVWFVGSGDKFSTAFWMLKTLFVGSYISILLSELTWSFSKKFCLMVDLLLIIIFLRLNSLYILFPLGNIIALKIIKIEGENKELSIINFAGLLIGLFLAGYPTEVVPNNIYRYLAFPSFVDKAQFAHILASFLIIYNLLSIYSVKSFFSREVFTKLGRMSYAIYLLHVPILCTFSSSIFNIIYSNCKRYQLSVMITFILSNLVVLLLSYIFLNYIEIKLYGIIDNIITHENIN